MKSFNNTSIDSSVPLSKNRAGVTLSEVLIAMLLMSIGVVSLATLFPISVLRTAQATQLTHAVFLRNNAEAAIESNLGLLSNTNIGIGTAPTLAVVDPLGFQNGLGAAFTASIMRTNGGAATMVAARQLASLPDSWALVAEDKLTAATSTSATVSNAITGMTPATVNYRAILLDSTGKLAVVRYLTGVTGATYSWGLPLPTTFTPARVRIEVQDIKYSYMLTVRKSWLPTVSGDTSWESEIDVAVFFNRSFKPADETEFLITLPGNVNSGMGIDNNFGVAGVDDDGLNGADDAGELRWPGSDDNRTIMVTGTPFLKKGGYMLETSRLKWYRIVNFSVSSGSALVLLDRDLRVDPNAAGSTAIFMKGIVDVFPLGVRTGQQ